MTMNYAVGYVATVFYLGEKTKFKYSGRGEWEFISGENSPARYEQLINMVASSYEFLK